MGQEKILLYTTALQRRKIQAQIKKKTLTRFFFISRKYSTREIETFLFNHPRAVSRFGVGFFPFFPFLLSLQRAPPTPGSAPALVVPPLENG
jgi:hypothetical protein